MIDGSASRGCRIFGRLRPVRMVRKRGATAYPRAAPSRGQSYLDFRSLSRKSTIANSRPITMAALMARARICSSGMPKSSWAIGPSRPAAQNAVAKNTKTVSTLPEMPNMTRTPTCPPSKRGLRLQAIVKGGDPCRLASPQDSLSAPAFLANTHQRASLSHGRASSAVRTGDSSAGGVEQHCQCVSRD
jgi:hypothetical protein